MILRIEHFLKKITIFALQSSFRLKPIGEISHTDKYNCEIKLVNDTDIINIDEINNCTD